ncbi:MAG: ATP-binding protein [Rudaea sp.]
MSLLRLYFLGPIRFEHDGHPVEITAAKSVALLAYLAANTAPQPRERLLGLLWANSSQDAARKNLRNALWGIGRALGDHVVRVDEERLALDAEAWADIREFEADFKSERPQQAAGLYRGEFLAHFSLPDSPEFEIWLTSERERLAQMYLHAVGARIQQESAAGEWREVVALARRALAEDNLQEPLYRALIEAHARLGERAEALREYDALQATLERELGVEPLHETRALRDAIASGEFEREAAPVRQAAPAREPTARAPRIPFVGRELEQAALDAELADALAGHARAALLTGEVGIGKSRLWQEWSARIAGKATVLSCHCLEATQTLPFAPLIELFGSRSPVRRLLTPNSPVPRVWLAEVARLMPEIRLMLPDLPASAVLPPEEERRRILEAFTQCVMALPPPLVLSVDDLHWADHATLDWLDYLIHRMQDSPLLLVAAYRLEDAPARLVQMAARWGREGIARRIPLTRLSDEQAAALVAALGGAQESDGRAQSQSGGNPYFLIELATSPSGDVPAVLTDLIRARLGRLPDAARQVLQAAAVLEPDFDFAELRRTSGRGEEETLDALDALLQTGVLVESEGHYNFAHPLVATIVREGLSGARRVFIHRRAAEALLAAYAGHPAAIAGRLSDHYLEAGDKPRAAAFAEMAGEHALALAAPDEAVAFYRRALELDPNPARYMGLGRVLLRQVELPAARAAFETALKGFQEQGDRRGAARAALNIAETIFPSGDFREAQRWMEISYHYLDVEGDPESRVLLNLLLGSSELNSGAPRADAEKRLDDAAALAAEYGLRELQARADFMRGNLLAERGELKRAIGAFEQSIEEARAGGNDFQEVLGHNNAAYHALLAGDLGLAHEHIDAGLSLAAAHALRLPLQHLYSTRGEIALAEGQWAEAEDWFTRGLAEAEHNRNRREQANYRANLGLAARGRGDLDGAVMLLEAARSAAAELSEPHLQAKIDLHLAELYIDRGERTAAREALNRARKLLKGSGRQGLLEWQERLAKEQDTNRRQ